MSLIEALRVIRTRRYRIFASLCALLTLSACDPPGKPPLEPVSQDVTSFEVLYSENCAGCHGVDGKNGPGRILNDPLYLAVLPRETLKQILIYGRPGTAMPAWAKDQGGPLTPKQIDALVNGIETNWAKPVDFHGAKPPAYASNQQGEADVGRKLFLRNCFMCHGPGARVGPVTDPSYLSLASNQLIRSTIISGRPDLGMPDYLHLKAGKALSDDDITNLVAFLSSKRPSISALGAQAGQQAGPTGTHADENGPGQGPMTKGNEGSGNGPGSPRQERGEGNKSTGSSSQRGVK